MPGDGCRRARRRSGEALPGSPHQCGRRHLLHRGARRGLRPARPNGAGKTTTIGILTTRVLPTSGDASVAGVDVAADPVTARSRLSVVPQRPNLDRALTARQNLIFHAAYHGLGRAERNRRADALLDAAGSRRPRQGQGGQLLGRHGPAAAHRPRAHARPAGALPRRADHRPGPAGPAVRLGPRTRAAGQRGDRRPHHARHGRGRDAHRPGRRSWTTASCSRWTPRSR